MDAITLTEGDIEIINQRICAKFVADEVIACVSDMVELTYGEDLTNKYAVNYEDVRNLSRYPEYYGEYAKFEGGAECDKEEEIERLEDLWESIKMLGHYEGDDDLETIESCIDSEIHELNTLGLEDAEIFEWWIVTSWLGRKLEEKGYPVVERSMGWLWGRTTTGQSISIDYVIRQICQDMEFLYGQKNESRYHQQ